MRCTSPATLFYLGVVTILKKARITFARRWRLLRRAACFRLLPIAILAWRAIASAWESARDRHTILREPRPCIGTWVPATGFAKPAQRPTFRPEDPAWLRPVGCRYSDVEQPSRSRRAGGCICFCSGRTGGLRIFASSRTALAAIFDMATALAWGLHCISGASKRPLRPRRVGTRRAETYRHCDQQIPA
jgi:hypothetical protein